MIRAAWHGVHSSRAGCPPGAIRAFLRAQGVEHKRARVCVDGGGDLLLHEHTSRTSLRHATCDIQHAACNGGVGMGYSTPAFSAVACNMQLATCKRYHAAWSNFVAYEIQRCKRSKREIESAACDKTARAQPCKGTWQLPPAMAQADAPAQAHAAARARTRVHAPRASAVVYMEHENDFVRLHQCGWRLAQINLQLTRRSLLW